MNPRIKKFLKHIEKFFVSCKQFFILQYLLTNGGRQLIEKYRTKKLADCDPITDESPIWTCWWQGEKSMPEIVKACYNSIKIHAGTHPVILITENNYAQYIEIPDYIIRKRQNGTLDLTHFSDILRMLLLQRHGGIWLDCTVLIPSKKLNEFINSKTVFWSCHHLPIYYNISKGGWTSFFLACGRNNILPSFIADMHLCYWKTHNKLIDYLLLDYTFAIARKYLSEIHQMIENIPITKMGPLGKCLNDEYSDEKWEEFCTKYDFHKLTYKIPLSLTSPNGRKTFYAHIMETYHSQY